MVLFRRDVIWKTRKMQLIVLLEKILTEMTAEEVLNQSNFLRGMLYVLAIEEVVDKLLGLLYRGDQKVLHVFIEDTTHTNSNMFSQLDVGEFFEALINRIILF